MGRTLAEVWVAVRGETSKLGPDIRKGANAGDAAAAGRSSGNAFTSGFKSGVAGVGRIATAALATVATGAVAAGGFGLKIASQNEQAEISFTTMLGSAQKAQAFLSQMQAFAAKTPFEFPELQTAASSLISAGVEASKVIPIMTSLGNATSGMGTGSEGVKRATVALQQMSAAGRITGEDLNQLRDAGVPVFDLLAAATGKSKTEVANLAQTGKLGKKELDQLFKALESGKGLERFSGLMDKQSASLSGMLATFKDTFGQGLAGAIKPALPIVKNGLQAASDQAQGFFAGLSGKGKLAGFSGTVNEIGLGLRAMVLSFQEGDVTSDGLVGNFERAGVAGRQLWLGIKALVAAYREGDVTSDGFVGTMERLGVRTRQVFDYVTGTAVPAAREWFAQLRTGGGDSRQVGESFGSIADSLLKIGPAVQGASTSLPSFTDTLTVGSRVLAFLADNIDTVVKFMPLLVAGVVAYKAAQAAANIVQLLAVPTKIAEVAVNRQLVKSNQALIASRVGVTGATAAGTVVEAASTGAKNAGIIASLRARAAAIGSAAAQLIVSGATAAWTGAQWLLNAALSANPIGLVIAAIALLAAGIVLAWRRSETFQAIVKGAMAAVAEAGRFMWNEVLLPVFRAFQEAPGKVSAAFGAMRDTLAGVWEAVKGAAQTGVRFVVDKFLGMVQNILDGASRAFGWVPGLGGKLKDAARNFSVFRDQVNTALGGVKSRNVKVSATLQGLSASRAAAEFATGGPVFGAGTATSDSIPAMLSNGEHVWTAKEVTAAGGQAAVGRMRKAVLTGQVAAFAQGGPVGFSISPQLRGMDRFEAAIAAFNARLDKAATKLALAGGGGGFSPGLAGGVRWAQSVQGRPYTWGGMGRPGWDCSGFLSDVVNTVQGRARGARRFTTSTLPANLFAPGPGAFNIGWFTGNPGHVAATVNGVPMESRGGDGVVVGSRSRGASQSIFNRHAHLRGYATGGPVLPGDPPFDLLDKRGLYFDPGLRAALAAGAQVMDRGGHLEPGWNPPIYNGTGRAEPVTTARSMDQVVGELRALRAAVAELARQPVVVDLDSRPVARAVRSQTIRNTNGW